MIASIVLLTKAPLRDRTLQQRREENKTPGAYTGGFLDRNETEAQSLPLRCWIIMNVS